MNTWAIIKSGGKQYKVSEGEFLEIEKIKGDQKGNISFAEILLVSNEKGIILGRPLVSNVRVSGKIVESFRDKKIRVVKFKSKSRYLRTTGHRQTKTKVLIEKIES